MYPLFDLTKFITNLVGYTYYAGWVVVGVSVILSVYYFALMHDSENGKRALTFTIAAAAVLLGGFAAITSIAQSPAPSFQGGRVRLTLRVCGGREYVWWRRPSTSLFRGQTGLSATSPQES